MFRNFAALGVSTSIRIVTGFLLFVLLARHWGALKFGEFMYLFAITALLVQACEYGFSQQILREIGRNPEAALKMMGEYFSAKIWLTGVTWILAIAVGLLSNLDAHHFLTMALLLLAGTLMSYSDFLLACFRALGKFGNETSITLWGNLIYFSFGMVALYADWGLAGFAASLAVGRALHLLITTGAFRRHFSGSIAIALQVQKVWPVIKNGGAYGLSVVIAAGFVNLDTVLVTHVLGFASTGTYQAAARFYQGAILLPPIFAALFLPKMARATAQPQLFTSQSTNLNWLMLLTGTLFAAIFVISAQEFHLIYPDPGMSTVQELIPWFGLLALLHFIAAAQGITVTAFGGQMFRAGMTTLALILMATFSYPLMLALGPVGMIIACCLAYSFLYLAFWWWSERQGIRSRVSSLATVAVAVAIGTFIFMFQN